MSEQLTEHEQRLIDIAVAAAPAFTQDQIDQLRPVLAQRPGMPQLKTMQARKSPPRKAAA